MAVVGAGIAGLTAAALLAARGYRVVVVERDVHPGGCAAGFTRDGYRFAVGATVATGFERGGLHRRIYDHLGLEPRYVNVSPALRVHLPDRVVRVMTERPAWEAELARVFPGQEPAKRAFWRHLARLADGMYHAATRFPVMPFTSWCDLADTARAVHPRLLPLLFLHDGGNLLVSTSPYWDRSRAPEGKRAVTVSTHVDAERWMALDKASYESEKRYMEDCMLSTIEQLWPKVKSGIEVFMSGSPRTFHNFTRRLGGTVGGTPQVHGHSNFAATSHRSDVRGLFLAGDTVFPGQGTIGVTVSGYNAARSAARYLSSVSKAPIAPPRHPKEAKS